MEMGHKYFTLYLSVKPVANYNSQNFYKGNTSTMGMKVCQAATPNIDQLI